MHGDAMVCHGFIAFNNIPQISWWSILLKLIFDEKTCLARGSKVAGNRQKSPPVTPQTLPNRWVLKFKKICYF
jgi:hypothetical protein